MGKEFQDSDGILKRGDEGTAVANWQRFLNSQGFSVEADGDFGTNTAHATQRFQQRYNLTPDGIAGRNTLEKAEALLAKTAQPIHASAQEPKSLAVPAGANAQRLAKVHPNLAMRALQVISAAAADGYTLQVSQGLRTFAEQDALFAKRPRVTQARGGQSMHNYGFAVDFVFIVNGKISWEDALYNKIGKWARPTGLEWGGDWRNFVDRPHCQLPGLPSYKVLLPVYQQGGLKAVWERFVK